MSMSDLVRRAVLEVVREQGQNQDVADRLIAWIEAAPDASRADDEAESFQRLDAILNQIQVDEAIDDEERTDA